MSVFDKYKKGLSKTKKGFFSGLISAITGKKEIGSELIEEVEDILLGADLGYEVVSDILEKVEAKLDGKIDMEVLFKDALYDILKGKERSLKVNEKGLTVYFFVGVNGVGKTTTIAKIAQKLKKDGKKVLIAAGDTYRAAGGTQMKLWGDKLGIRVISHERGGDPSAVLFDAIDSAVSQNYDFLLIDTAGRLHTKVNLMEELEKMRRTIRRKLDRDADETILVIDATTGQNALKQLEIFNKKVGITSVVVTKMDGSAKGGIIFPIEKHYNIPVKFIGLGEKEDDLEQFSPEYYVDALFREDE